MGNVLVELVEHSWADLSDEEREAFREWLKGARPEDLYLLMRHCRRRWSRKPARSQTMEAVRSEPEES